MSTRPPPFQSPPPPSPLSCSYRKQSQQQQPHHHQHYYCNVSSCLRAPLVVVLFAIGALAASSSSSSLSSSSTTTKGIASLSIIMFAHAHVDGATITNPYYRGCLQNKVPNWNKLRVCNSNDDRQKSFYYGSHQDHHNNDDNDNKNNKDSSSSSSTKQLLFCQEPHFDYLEIRVGTGNWDSSTAMGWLVQIILSEILGVPSTIEAGGASVSRDFYHPQAEINYDNSVAVGSMATANELENGDCRSLHRNQKNTGITTTTTADIAAEVAEDEDVTVSSYQACAHVLPETWGLDLERVRKGEIEPQQGLGVLGLETWFVTKFTADEYPQVVSYHGLQKPSNRQLLADLFQRPTTWGDYCTQISPTNCTAPDGTAQRAPADAYEAQRMFVPDGVFTGHFRPTDKNNCTASPDECTGHIANFPCGWSSNMEAVLYHLDIPLDCNNGENGAPGGYTSQQLKDMWDAANATRSHLMMMWWLPEPLYQKYLGTDAEMQRVLLKPYTMECERNLVLGKDECSDDLATRVGVPEAACEYPPEPLRKSISANLREILLSPDIPDAARNPAYDMLHLFQISDVQLGELFDLLEVHETPRDAVCTWAADNLQYLQESYIPESYPRITKKGGMSNLGYAALITGCAATLLIALTAWGVYRNKNKPSIVFAQLDFLSVLLVGSFLVGIGAILSSLPSSHGTCLASIWFVYVGYTLELVPLIVKVAAINRIMESSRDLRRVTVKRPQLYRTVGFICAGIIVYLAVWTTVDRPHPEKEYVLTKNVNQRDDEMFVGERIVDEIRYCHVDAELWRFTAETWNAILLLSASVLAYQSRNTIRAFNESRTLAFLIYSHFVFVILRMITLTLSDYLEGSVLNFGWSIFYAIDQAAGCAIYFLPKLWGSKDEEIALPSSSNVNLDWQVQPTANHTGTGTTRAVEEATGQSSGEESSPAGVTSSSPPLFFTSEDSPLPTSEESSTPSHPFSE